MKLALTIVAVQVASGTAVSPIQKVIQLLEGMVAKGTQEKQDEATAYSAYEQFCSDTKTNKAAAIAQEEEEIEGLSAEIQKLQADREELQRDIKKLTADEEKYTKELGEENDRRQEERDINKAKHQDLSESVDGLEGAIAVIKKKTAQFKDTEDALLQVSSLSRMPESARKAINSFLLTDTSASAKMELEENASPLAGILEMLRDLYEKFRHELRECEKEELNSKHHHEMVVDDLTKQIQNTEKSRSNKSDRAHDKKKRQSKAEAEKADSEATKAEDEAYLSDLTAECAQKSTDFAARQQLRAQELEAINQAINIMSSPEVAGSGQKHLKLAQKGSSFAQLRSSVRDPTQQKVAEFLLDQGRKYNLPGLLELSNQVSADVFGKVKKMIKGMIYKLQEEANEEAEHKGWCDKEVGTNTQTRETKSNEVDDLNSEIEELKAHISKLSEETGDLSAGISAIDKAMGKATEDRKAEREKNEETIAEAQDAQKAVQSAMAVLKEFYAKAGQATALLQHQQEAAMYEAEIMSANPDAPDTFEGPYKGMQGMNGGGVGMLEGILSDFARLEATTHAEEAEAEEEFKRFSVESSRDKAVKSRDIEHKDRQREQAQGDLAARERDLDSTTEELEAAERYYQKLKPSCVDAGISYDDRVQKREQEIQSLKEALDILKNAYA
mmetsp:Transcript_116419/g.267263  ORF Transcript_116419/g.267263 Transcript_116419/m.267263 type:complete len:671 (+) Transcript_116419:195-2207(+)